LAVRYTVQKSRPISNVKVKLKGQGHQGHKKRKNADSSPLTMHTRAYVVGRTQLSATDDTITLRGRPGVTGYADGKISACCLVIDIVVVALVVIY